MRAADRIELGPEPRANLLPPEVHRDAGVRRTRRLMVYLVLLVAAAVVGGYAVSSLAAAQQQSELAEAQARTQELLNERQSYGEVTALTNIIATTMAARELGTATEVLWTDPLGDVLSILPAGSTIRDIDAVARLPWESDLGVTGPLRAERAASVQLTVATPSTPDAVAVVRTVEMLDWVADVSIAKVESTDGLFLTTFMINLNQEALLLRFAEASADDEEEGVDE